MLAVISSTTWDPTGYVELDTVMTQTRGDTTRRVNRIATLDGGAVVSDQGATDADRTIIIEWQSAGKDVEQTIETMVQLYSRLNVSIDGAVYLTAPSRYTPGETSQLELLVLSKVSA